MDGVVLPVGPSRPERLLRKVTCFRKVACFIELHRGLAVGFPFSHADCVFDSRNSSNALAVRTNQKSPYRIQFERLADAAAQSERFEACGSPKTTCYPRWHGSLVSAIHHDPCTTRRNSPPSALGI